MRESSKRKLDQLHESPLQQDLFGDLPDQDIDDLAASMREEGLHHSVEILSDGTIIDGHQRVRAAQQLGWTEIDVVVRDDLEAEGEAAVERRMIEANALRRQLDIIAMARLYRRLKEIERDCPSEEFTYSDRGDLRDRLAAKLGGRSGRTLDRYERVLATPRAVQNAVSRGDLGLTQALKVADLQTDEQDQIAQQILDGRPAKEVVAEYTARMTQTVDDVMRYRKLLNTLDRELSSLDPVAEHVVGRAVEGSRACR